ncbi:MAG: hypothetical protein ACPGF7_14540 [Pontibacterium sp.]
MFSFDMSVQHNHAMFRDGKQCVIVDSFDNQIFDVRYGTLRGSVPLTTICATTDEELNEKLSQAVATLNKDVTINAADNRAGS